jgi:thiol:disulfide interchange protein
MERVKQLMGFFLVATLLFLLWVIGAERGYEAIIWASCFLLALSVVCWMKGAFMVTDGDAGSAVCFARNWTDYRDREWRLFYRRQICRREASFR